MTKMMLSSHHMLELINVSHTGQVEDGSCLQSLFGYVPTGVILKDVSFEVRGGEVMAVLGSKGSGKRALLEVISRRAQGPTKGQILLNGVGVSLKLFQQCCGFVTQRVDLLPGLTTRQSLHYSAKLTIGSKVSSGMKRTRVKQVMADLALHQVANRDVTSLTASEYRRLTIGMQLVRDPVVLLLDEPTADLDPLNTYFIVSILSNHAKKYSRIVILTMEKPRSDIFPFLDRVTYLCMGDVVYTGSTRMMLDYFRNIGFPCPELENPLMYYLCLATVDRRSRERLMDSSNQIGALVDKFRLEGGPFRKGVATPSELELTEPYSKVSLTVYGTPSSWTVFWTLFFRIWQITWNGLVAFNKYGLRDILLRWLALPLAFTFLFLFYFRLSDFQKSYVSRTGLLFHCMAVTSLLAAGITAVTFAPHRTRFYQEIREGLYRGPQFILCQIFYSFPISFVSVLTASAIIYWSTGLRMDGWRWIMFTGVLWTCYSFVELQTVTLMMLIKNSYTAATTSIFTTVLYIVNSSGTVRSLIILPDWLYYLTFVMIYRYAGAFLNENEFADNLYSLPTHYNTTDQACLVTNANTGCVYLNGTHYLSQRYHLQRTESHDNDLVYFRNFGLCFVFCGGMALVNLFVYLIPLPSFVKSKFRQ